MPEVNLERAKQLVRASALAYESGTAAVKASQHFAGSALIDNPQLKQPGDAIDSVLIGQTDFGVVVAFRGTLPPTKRRSPLGLRRRNARKPRAPRSLRPI